MNPWTASVTAGLLATGALGGAEVSLGLRDDLGRAVPGVEACFWYGPERRCPAVPAGEPLRWPADATALRVAAPGHGPVWIEEEDLPQSGVLVVPRKAELSVEDLPAGAGLAFYRAEDPVFRVPLDEVRPVDPAAPVLVPAGATVLAIRSRGNAPDLHRLDAPPGGRASVRYTPRTGWSAVIRVTDAARRRPLPGAHVRLLETSPLAPARSRKALATASTEPDGLVLVSGIEAAMATVAVEHPGRAPRRERGLIAPAGDLLLQEVALRSGGALDARILNRGEPAAEASCVLVVEPDEAGEEVAADGVAGRTRADREGRCRLENVPEGHYLLRVTVPERPEIADLPVRIEDGEVAEAEADLRVRPIRGRVLRGGEPAPGYRVTARTVWRVVGEGEGGRHRFSLTVQSRAVAGPDGSFELPVLLSRFYVLHLYAPDGAGIASRLLRVGPDGAETTFSLEARAVTGRVVSTGGSPVAGARVILRWPTSDGRRRILRTTAAGDGSFELPVLEPGRGRVDASLEGFQPAAAEVALGDPDLPSEVELVLRPFREVRGRVVSGRGEPVAGVRVTSCLDLDAHWFRCPGDAVTGPDGRFSVPAEAQVGTRVMSAPPIRLWASGPGCALVDLAVPGPRERERAAGRGATTSAPAGPAGADEPVVIRCDDPPSVLRLHLAFSASHPLEGHGVVLRRDRHRVVPTPALRAHLEHLGLPRATDALGRLLLVLSPGTWEVFLDSGNTVSTVLEGELQGLLGSVALDPLAVTDLYTGADPRR